MLADYSTLSGRFLNRNTEPMPTVIPAEAGIQASPFSRRYIPSTLIHWIPVCTGMKSGSLPYSVIPRRPVS